MGLDNGIVMKHKKKIDFPKWFRSENINEDDGSYYESDICYWRKCWNIRRDVADVLGAGFVDSMDGAYSNVNNPKTIGKIIKALEKYKKKSWNSDYEDGYTIWEWFYKDCGKKHGYKFVLEKDIKSLKWVKKYMKKHKSNVIDIYFYDSY